MEFCMVPSLMISGTAEEERAVPWNIATTTNFS